MLSPYMKESDVKIVCNNIKSWITNEDAAIVSVSTDGRLGSIDLRHLVWNIGERFNWKGEKRALFAKMVFPIELRDIEVSTIRRNLRQRGTCIIDLDIPEKVIIDSPFNLSEITFYYIEIILYDVISPSNKPVHL